jgi:hypothetical protein
MIKRMMVEGRPATVAYITNNFEPVSPDDADMVKVAFDDGEVRFGVKAETDKLKGEWRSQKRRAEALLKDWLSSRA